MQLYTATKILVRWYSTSLHVCIGVLGRLNNYFQSYADGAKHALKYEMIIITPRVITIIIIVIVIAIMAYVESGGGGNGKTVDIFGEFVFVVCPGTAAMCTRGNWVSVSNGYLYMCICINKTSLTQKMGGKRTRQKMLVPKENET